MTSHTTTGTLVSFLCLFLSLWVIPVWCSLPSEFSIAGYAPGSNATGRALELFEEWRLVHRRVYRDPAEKAQGFENFLVNMEYVLGRNARKATHSPSHAVGLNRFADLSNEEFKTKYLSRIPRASEMRRRSRVGRDEVDETPLSCQAPRSLDWRKKGAVTFSDFRETKAICYRQLLGILFNRGNRRYKCNCYRRSCQPLRTGAC